MVLGLCVRGDCIIGSTPNETSMLSIISVTIFQYNFQYNNFQYNFIKAKLTKNMLIRSFPIYYHNSAIMAATVWNLDGEKRNTLPNTLFRMADAGG